MNVYYLRYLQRRARCLEIMHIADEQWIKGEMTAFWLTALKALAWAIEVNVYLFTHLKHIDRYL